MKSVKHPYNSYLSLYLELSIFNLFIQLLARQKKDFFILIKKICKFHEKAVMSVKTVICINLFNFFPILFLILQNQKILIMGQLKFILFSLFY